MIVLICLHLQGASGQRVQIETAKAHVSQLGKRRFVAYGDENCSTNKKLRN